MKKIINLVMIIFAIFICASCSCNKDVKVSLQIGDMNATSYKNITLGEFDEMVENKHNFILYVYRSDCENCMMFKPIIENAIQKRHLNIYAIESSLLKSNHQLSEVKKVPTVLIYENGKKVLKTDPIKNEEYFSNNAGFLKFLDKYTYMPTLYYITKEQLDEKIASDEKFIIYYSRSSCTDCSYLNDNFLREYLNKNTSKKKFYIIETDAEGIRYSNGVLDANLWQNFKDTYGLSEANNSLGHGVGYVPTMQYYEDGKIKDMLVYFNDFESFQNPDGSYSVIINNSYYDDNPYIGQTIVYKEYKEKLAPFYDQKVKSFLDINLEKVG